MMELKRMGAKVSHDISSKTMKHHTYPEMRLFDRVIFDFPHA